MANQFIQFTLKSRNLHIFACENWFAAWIFNVVRNYCRKYSKVIRNLLDPKVREKREKEKRDWSVKGAREWYKWNFLMRWIRMRCVLPAAAAAVAAVLGIAMGKLYAWNTYLYTLGVCVCVCVYTGWKCSGNHHFKKHKGVQQTMYSLQPHFCFFSFMRCLVAQLLACLFAHSIIRTASKEHAHKSPYKAHAQCTVLLVNGCCCCWI